MASDELPHEVILSIQRVLDIQPTEEIDRLDGLSQKFNAIAILNDFFPDEASLAHLEAVSAHLAETHQELQSEVNSLQSELRVSQDPERMSVIQEMISDLLGQMSRIREKATESEAVVRNITKDIQVLDLAKKNLITSMTMMKRLQMLVNALTQLEDLIKEKKYSEVAQTLAAVKQISSSFKSYTAVPRINRVWKHIQDVQARLKTQLDADFDAFYLQDSNNKIKAPLIADACLVVDVLGPDVKAHVIERFVALELKEYRRIFRTNDEAGQLDNISRRFAWFRRLLQTHELEQGRVFPAEWRVSWHLLAKFTEISRDDVTTLLTKAGSNLTVKSLLDNLAMTTEFEQAMSKKWATPFKEMLKATDNPHSEPGKPISAAFEPHMGIFVDAQDKVLVDMLAPHRRGKGSNIKVPARASMETTSGTEDNTSSPMVVLPSSTDLFYFYAQSLEQCAKLSTGQALFDLCTVHKKWLRIYAEEVLAVDVKRPVATSRKSTEGRFDLELIKQICLSINTADYCQTTALELEEKVKEKINPEFKEKITFQVECDLFVSSISTAINVILREFEANCDPSFTTLSRMSWSSINQVSGPSPYTGELVKSAEQVVEYIKPRIEQKKYLRNIFDKASSIILVKFTNSLVRSRPLKEIGAEQLLIDLQTIKAFLVKMPGDTLASTSYTRSLNKTTTRLEALLKVIVTPVDPPEGFILNYTLLIGDASFSNFQKILDLKGTAKATQNNLLDSFLTITSTKTDLESTSFLSSLDMDPPMTGHAGGSLVSPGASRVSLPLGGSEGIFASMTGPGQSGPTTGSSTADNAAGRAENHRREVFSDFRRFVSFGLRKDSTAPS
ncbi:Vacuolar protein sorting-associated protein 53-like protein [Psilocybe cubensis]|uniref:Vps53 N-terminal domain-containing protein n=2 Tax=Psilocybe cubensis TaxID=181762 RepID=A0A8H8CNX9_PSICU|nr:Vacuolar protein sorting-associated protein 53-like protein [Psilocybe cubensis]KAH9484873.1 Vacuolar protein sorting-associated protein 53-like protein [Psilocybe cubensis]